MLANISRHTKNLVMSVPRNLLNSRKILIALLRFITRSFVHSSYLTSSQIVILCELLLLLLFFPQQHPSISLFSNLLELSLILKLAFFSFVPFCITLLKLLLLPCFPFSSHFCLFLLCCGIQLVFFLRAFHHDYLLFLSSSFFGNPAPILLLLLIFSPQPILIFSLSSHTCMSVALLNILFPLSFLGFFPSFNFCLKCNSFFISLFADSHQLHLFIDFLIFLVLHSPALIFHNLALSGMTSIVSLIGFNPSESLLLLLQALINCVHFGAMRTSIIILFLSCNFFCTLNISFCFTLLLPLLALIVLASTCLTSLSLSYQFGFSILFSLLALFDLRIMVVLG